MVFLQETHFRSNNIPKLHNRFDPTAFHASNVEYKSKGVSIFISKNFPIQILDTMKDVHGDIYFWRGHYTTNPSR